MDEDADGIADDFNRAKQVLDQKRAEFREDIRDLESFVHNARVAARKEVWKEAYRCAILAPISAMAGSANVGLRLNEDILLVAVSSYYNDIERVRSFHGYNHANRPKKAAYTAKWLLKLRPISYDDVAAAGLSPKVKKSLLRVNEYYALLCAFLAGLLDINDLKIEAQNDLIYQFVFDEIRSGELVSWFNIYFEMNGIDRHVPEQ